jgi:hypothetical protein
MHTFRSSRCFRNPIYPTHAWGGRATRSLGWGWDWGWDWGWGWICGAFRCCFCQHLLHSLPTFLWGLDTSHF